jgi:hypothetical protein
MVNCHIKLQDIHYVGLFLYLGVSKCVGVVYRGHIFYAGLKRY